MALYCSCCCYWCFFFIPPLVLLSSAIKPSLIGIKYNTKMKTHTRMYIAARLTSRRRVLMCILHIFYLILLSFHLVVWGLILRKWDSTIKTHKPFSFTTLIHFGWKKAKKNHTQKNILHTFATIIWIALISVCLDAHLLHFCSFLFTLF